MAEKSNDSIGKTLLVVLVLCLVCSIVVAGSAVGLKSRQQAQRALDKQRNIGSVRADAPRYGCGCGSGHLRGAHYPRLVNLATGELLEKDPGKFNQAQALKDPQQSMAGCQSGSGWYKATQ
ncbi:Na(+)-translocating NADH-quinone reductase subunit C [Klebsiella pneumoniae]|nr:Na(+)-translocating NADH-quinone reductase subunit C [Klebsiella pneumoniae]